MIKTDICEVIFLFMNIQKYIAFIKTVEYGSFSKTAEMLNFSQSGISRMVNDLEREWGVSLLERSHFGVSLTSDGLKLFPYAKNVCSEYFKLEEQVKELNNIHSGFIRIGTFSSIATHWLPNIIKEFQKDYPGIDYELLLGDYSEIEKWILEGRVDCGFVRLPTFPEFDTIFLERDELFVILPQNHPLAHKEKFPIKSLNDYPFMLLEKGSKADISYVFEKYKISPKVHFITWDDYAIMSMVESGLGISILPELILKRVPYKITMLPLEIPAYREIGIAIRDKKRASLAVKKFLEYIKYK